MLTVTLRFDLTDELLLSKGYDPFNITDQEAIEFIGNHWLGCLLDAICYVSHGYKLYEEGQND